ncbi:MAG: rhomboid family intramembrane serine protease [Gammaproteobacteria bacterium]|nr:rhomboid family intramembrane serine protease [Gammaproteobacteria bacterium]MBV9724917.1 rhomboid family intramembrane serine protease [Gammaproteobacteria bacterium]
MFSMPRATRTLILINVGVYLLELLNPRIILGLFALWPLHTPLFQPWQLITYGFLHDPTSPAHIFFNMFALFMFGRSLESYWGPRRFVIYYLVCIVAAGLTQLAVQQAGGVQEETIGASGGIFGVLLAFAWYFPRQRLFIIPIPIPIPAWLFVTGYALIELFYGVTGRGQGVAHFAHLGGLLGGALCILYWRARHRFAA